MLPFMKDIYFYLLLHLYTIKWKIRKKSIYNDYNLQISDFSFRSRIIPINVVRTNKLLIRYKKSQEITNDEQIESFEVSVYKHKIV